MKIVIYGPDMSKFYILKQIKKNYEELLFCNVSKDNKKQQICCFYHQNEIVCEIFVAFVTSIQEIC